MTIQEYPDVASAISKYVNSRNISYMIRFRDKPKDKAANANTRAKDVASAVAQTSETTKETADLAEPRPNAEPAKSEDVKQ